MTETDRSNLRDKVRIAYSTAAEMPNQKHAFPVGRGFAQSLGYPADLLDQLPAVASDAFAGVLKRIHIFAEIPSGAPILDLGCGAGLDALIAARRIGPARKVIAVDFSTAMLDRARQAAAEAGASNLELREAGAEQLPIADEEIDVALVNGIFNLNPSRDAIFRELARVVRRGGTVFAAELILSSPLPAETRASESNWFA
jgi:arsenite methyltransferase